MFNAPSNFRFNALQFHLSVTGTYDDVFLRPYTLHYDKYTNSHLQEATNNGTDINMNTLSGVASSIVRPSSTVGSVAPLVNGFSQRRCRFVLEMTPIMGTSLQLSSGVRHILTGYTDDVGIVNQNGQHIIDPNMRLFLNACYVVRDEPSPVGAGVVSTITESYQFLANPAAATDMMQAMGLYAIRPEDLYTQLDTSVNGFAAASGLQSIDERCMVNGRITRNSRSNALPTAWLSKTLNAFKSASFTDDDYDPSRVGIYEKARNEAREPAIAKNAFVRELVTDYNLTRDGSITYGDLLNVVANIDHVARVNNPTAANAAKLYQRGRYEHWHGSSYDAVASNILKMQLPALLLPFAVGGYSFYATNKIANMNGTLSHQLYEGNHRIDPLNIASFATNVDLTPMVPAINQRIAREILNLVSNNNEFTYEMTVDVNLLGDAVISIQIGDSPMITRAAPVFCDHMYASVLSDNQQHVSRMIEGGSQMLSGVSSMLNINPQRPVVLDTQVNSTDFKW